MQRCTDGQGEGRQAPTLKQRNQFRNEAPIITVFDHRGCKSHTNTEYKGKKAGNQVSLAFFMTLNPNVFVSTHLGRDI